MMKVGIVDAYSTGNKIRQRLLNRGVESFHIQSSVRPPALLNKSYKKDDFKVNILNVGCWDKLKNDVGFQSPTHIIAGSETGVILADKLAYNFQLPSNDFFLSEARRNKFLMIEAVRNSGLRVAWQLMESDLDKLLIRLEGKNYPFIMKPVSSSSGDGFRICHTKEDVIQAYNEIHGKINILDEENKHILCQELLVGTEFVVNSMTYNGIHYITDAWEMKHRHTNEIPMIIDSMTLLPMDDSRLGCLIEYTKKSLTALGVNFGPAHTELMLTDFGPALIEVNSRLMGGNIDDCFRDSLENYDQIDALIDCIVSPDNLISRLSSGYKSKNYIAEIDFIFYRDGVLKSFSKEDKIRKFKNFKKFEKVPLIGSSVKKTKSTTNVEGLLYLVGNDYLSLIEDRDKVVSWQKNDELFILE